MTSPAVQKGAVEAIFRNCHAIKSSGREKLIQQSSRGSGCGQWRGKESKKGQHMSHMPLEILKILKREFTGIRDSYIGTLG